MARLTFGGTIRDTVARRVRLIGHNVDDYGAATLTAWTTAVGGTQYTDLLVNGVASTTVPVGADGQIPEFQGPDGVTALWLSAAAGGVRVKMLAADDASYVPKSQAQSAEHSPIVLFTITPKTAGNELFQVHANSFANLGAGAGTYNHAVHIGWNASRHSNGPGTVNGKPAIYMGFEDNYFDYAGDLRYGVEWYVGYASPDGTTVPVTALRPFYTRVMSDTNAARSATTYMEIGTDSDGSWQVRKQVAEPLLNITPTFAAFYVPLTVTAQTTTLQSPAGSGVNLLLNAAAFNPAVIFQTAGAASWAIQAEGVNTFKIYDKNNRAHTAYTQGASAAAALTDFSSAVKAQGLLSAGSGAGSATVSATANDGTTPPAPTVTGNAQRGVVSFGSGASPAAGAIITVDLPTGFSTAPGVALTPANFATSGRAVYVNITGPTQFQICFGNAPSASQAAGTYAVAYMVLG